MEHSFLNFLCGNDAGQVDRTTLGPSNISSSAASASGGQQWPTQYSIVPQTWIPGQIQIFHNGPAVFPYPEEWRIRTLSWYFGV